MKFMTYGMPIMFFFILYNAPSGLLLYWTMQSVFSMIQQIWVNRRKKKEIENPSLVKLTRKQRKEEEARIPEAVRKYEEKKRRMALSAKGRKK